MLLRIQQRVKSSDRRREGREKASRQGLIGDGKLAATAVCFHASPLTMRQGGHCAPVSLVSSCLFLNSMIRPQQISRWMHFYMRCSHLDPHVNLIPSAASKTQTKRPSVALLLLTINPSGLCAGPGIITQSDFPWNITASGFIVSVVMTRFRS